MSAVQDLHARHARLPESHPGSAADHALGRPLLERARAAFLANDMAAFGAVCAWWLQRTRGVARGDVARVSGAGQRIELRVDDCALGWDRGGSLEQPLVWLYGPTVQPDGSTVALQWNRVPHDARIEKLARHSDALATLLA